MYARSWEMICSVWLPIALGTLLLLVATAAGWAIARRPTMMLGRVVSWWLRHVVFPLVMCRLWWCRAAAILVNNTTILAVLLSLGRWSIAPLFGVAALGLSLGVALRVMPDVPLPLSPRLSHQVARGYRVQIGLALNLLEPPAIMLTVGLSLAWPVMSWPASRVWETFVLWVVPATLLAAGGEATWLGAYRPLGESDRNSQPLAGNDDRNAG